MIQKLTSMLICVLGLTNLCLAQQDAPATANDATSPGKLTVDPPTLICLGFMWEISGDDNHNATCRVQYRKQGRKEWQDSLPLYRTGKGRTANYGFGNFGDPNHEMRYKIPEALAGSILDLDSGTTYEVKLTVEDPDGVKGQAVKTLTASTRPEPKPFEGGEVRHVYPPGYKGEREKPTYRSIMHAVNGFHTWCDCYQTVHPNRAKPGTIIKLHAGIYTAGWDNYRDGIGLWQHGTYTLIADGTKEKPIAIVAAGDGEVIIDGDGADNLFNIMAADYLYFEGLTIRNTRIAFHGGFQGVMGAKGLTVKRCKIENVGYGILAQDGRSSDFYIADNIIIGRNAPDQLHPLSGRAGGRSQAGYAVNLSGTGHVVCHNYTAQFWDCINVFTNALADPEMGQQALAIDFYNNDIHNICDNFIETDGGMRNLRVLRNRCFNCLATPISWQPVYQGPAYFIRNVVYNAARGVQAFKASGGDNIIGYHNTFSGHWGAYGGTGYGDFRNNLFCGPEDPGERRGSRRPYLNTGVGDAGSIFDYNAYRVGETFPGAFKLRYRGTNYEAETLDELAEKSGALQHHVVVPGYGIFENASEPDHAIDKSKIYYAQDVDLRPKPGSAVVDVGCVIPSVNEDFDGKAPDIGAYEAGRPMPVYGPRDEKLQQAIAQRHADIKAGKITYDREEALVYWPRSLRDTPLPRPMPKPVSTKPAGISLDKIEHKDEMLTSVTVGGKTITRDGMALGSIACTEYQPEPPGNFKLTDGIPGNARGAWNLDVTRFGGSELFSSSGGPADLLIFEIGANDDALVCALMPGGLPGRPVQLNRDAWTQTDLRVDFAAGPVAGIALKITDLRDTQGNPLKADSKILGIRLIATGLDPVCVCAVKPAK